MTSGPGRGVHLRLLRALGDPADVSPALLLAPPEPGRGARALPERALSGWRREASGVAALPRSASRQERMDARRARQPTEAHVPGQRRGRGSGWTHWPGWRPLRSSRRHDRLAAAGQAEGDDGELRRHGPTCS